MGVFYRYDIDLQNYQMVEIPKEIIPYEKRFRESLKTSINSFQRELHWDKMWTIWDAKKRLNNGWYLLVLRPKNQIKGWTWLTPEGEIKNVYISKWHRNLGWGKKIVLATMNTAFALGMDSVFYRCDTWNLYSKYLIERILLDQINCKCKVSEEDYEYE